MWHKCGMPQKSVAGWTLHVGFFGGIMLTGEVFNWWLDYHPVELMCLVDLLCSKDRWVAIQYYAYRWVDQP